ncbi:hypothetical protein [Nannocystis pusilla]|uniref:hypothetical protein n=1 Tax=Nannocystis pusilla TaxID=889268 RepID=UPI003B794BC6
MDQPHERIAAEQQLLDQDGREQEHRRHRQIEVDAPAEDAAYGERPDRHHRRADDEAEQAETHPS